MKSLTIEELKALEVGDYVWVVDMVHNNPLEYIKLYLIGDKGIVGKKEDGHLLHLEFGFGWGSGDLCGYGTEWLAYKNKEQSEAKGEIIELPSSYDEFEKFITQYSKGQVSIIEVYEKVVLDAACRLGELKRERAKDREKT